MEKKSTIILKITYFNQIRSLFGSLFLFVILIAFIKALIENTLSDKHYMASILAFLLCSNFLYLALPTLFLHINYLKRNRNEEYEIGDNMIIRRKNGIETYYSCEDISDIHLYQVDSMRIMRLPPWSDYHFVKILMKSGEVLYLTSLLYPSGLEEILDDYIRVSYLNETRWFPAT